MLLKLMENGKILLIAPLAPIDIENDFHFAIRKPESVTDAAFSRPSSNPCVITLRNRRK